jgi:hypothetical protein
MPPSGVHAELHGNRCKAWNAEATGGKMSAVRAKISLFSSRELEENCGKLFTATRIDDGKAGSELRIERVRGHRGHSAQLEHAETAGGL